MKPDAVIANYSGRSAVYHLVKDGRVIYIGQSANVMSRLGTHELQYDFARIFYCEIADLNDTELQHIQRFRPPFNREGVGKKFKPIPRIGRQLVAASNYERRNAQRQHTEAA